MEDKTAWLALIVAIIALGIAIWALIYAGGYLGAKIDKQNRDMKHDSISRDINIIDLYQLIGDVNENNSRGYHWLKEGLEKLKKELRQLKGNQ